jgi:Cd2+/Zn2+-exporting ATPase
MAQLTFDKILPKSSEAYAAAVCGILVLLGGLALHFNSVGLGILILTAAYVIGGYESTKDGLTTLWQEKELDVDLSLVPPFYKPPKPQT